MRLTDEQIAAIRDGCDARMKRGQPITACNPDTIRALATEALESRDALAEHEAAKEQAHQEGYDEGYREGQSDAAGAQSDLWRMMLRYFDKHGIEPASDDGEGYSAHQMMDALHEHESEVDAAHQAEIERLTKERDEARALADHAEKRHWHCGEPPKPQRDEWFIAETIHGDKVCLKALPEDWTYDYKTADETYIMARNIKRWMRFPDSHFIEPVPGAADARVAELEALLDVDRLTDIITDSIDLDWTPRTAARAIVRAIGGVEG